VRHRDGGQRHVRDDEDGGAGDEHPPPAGRPDPGRRGVQRGREHRDRADGHDRLEAAGRDAQYHQDSRTAAVDHHRLRTAAQTVSSPNTTTRSIQGSVTSIGNHSLTSPVEASRTLAPG
jgi:hypothetical protein